LLPRNRRRVVTSERRTRTRRTPPRVRDASCTDCLLLQLPGVIAAKNITCSDQQSAVLSLRFHLYIRAAAQ